MHGFSLAGNGGDDYLEGGAGQNYLYGGAGYDTYYVGENDIVVDSDHSGTIFYNGQNVADMQFLFLYEADGSEYSRETSSGTTVKYDSGAGTLTGLDGLFTSINFTNGDFGVSLVNSASGSNPVDRTLTGSSGDDLLIGGDVSSRKRHFPDELLIANSQNALGLLLLKGYGRLGDDARKNQAALGG